MCPECAQHGRDSIIGSRRGECKTCNRFAARKRTAAYALSCSLLSEEELTVVQQAAAAQVYAEMFPPTDEEASA